MESTRRSRAVLGAQYRKDPATTRPEPYSAADLETQGVWNGCVLKSFEQQGTFYIVPVAIQLNRFVEPGGSL
jgi:hypothetical protein